MKIKILIIFSILIIGIFLRFFHLGQLPPGLNADEASLGYDAYSILLTGKDQYGKEYPVFLRSFGAYQSPLYAYLTTIPIAFFGLSVFSVRLLSALLGVLLIVITLLLIWERKGNHFWQAVVASFIIAIAPWAIFFSRTAVEANLGLVLVVLGSLLLIKSLNKRNLFILASLVLGISTYAYQAQRLGSTLFLLGFIFLFSRNFLKSKKVVLIGIVLFFIIQIPQILLINTEAGTRRLDQVNYLSKDYFNQNSGSLKSVPLGRQIYIINQFSSHYLAYFSPKNLFFDPDPQEVRSIPDLSVFYSWMFIPFLFGLKVFWDKRNESFIKVVLLLMIISVVPAALTREPFYTLRVLPMLWVVSIVVSYGGFEILYKLQFSFLRFLLLLTVSIFSMGVLYSSYFILLKYERSSEYGFPYIELAKKSENLNSKKFVVDLTRQSQSYIWFAFFKKYDPLKLQEQGKIVLRDYYNASDFDGKRIIGNVKTGDIWDKEPCTSQIIVGDLLAISGADVKEHGLHSEFEISDLTEKVKLRGYAMNSKEKCL